MTEQFVLDGAGSVQVNDYLLERYLSALDLDELVQIAQSETKGQLSGLFLPYVTDAYLESPCRVMLIGKEPRAWAGCLLDLKKIEATPTAMKEYVYQNMQRHLAAAAQPHRRSKFMQFYTRLHAKLGNHVSPSRSAIFWGNVFCVSLSKGSPVNARNFNRLLEISQQLLAIQLDVLKPHVVIFASGPSYDSFIKTVLPERVKLDGFIEKKFWPFTTPRFTVYRTSHPRSHTKELRTLVLRSVRERVDQLAKEKAIPV